MQLVHEFEVSGPIERSWRVLTDVERVVPCMPGAQLTEVDGDVYRGLVRVKVGPMVSQFAGQASFRELDEAAHRAVLAGRGKEGSGRGMASVLVTAVLTEMAAEPPGAGPRTRVNLVIDLTIAGRLAQFGQGAMAEISGKLLGQFVECLERNVLAAAEPAREPAAEPASEPAREPAGELAREPAGEPAGEPTVGPTVRPAARPAVEAEPVDLLRSAGGPILKRAVPVLVVLAIVVVVIVVLVT